MSTAIPTEDEDSKPSAQPSTDQASFLAAAKSGDTETVKQALIKNKIDINGRDTLGTTAWPIRSTALIEACNSGHESIVRLLLNRDDILVNQTDNGNNTALMIGCRNGRVSSVKLLLGRKDIDVILKNNDGKTAYDLCSKGISKKTKRLLKGRMG
ncbi:ankyrin repeat-containing domain protein [Pyronema domesticum]|uniref:Similar to Osteoclast-stimulating factor 1 acc. no. Q8MJ50 n=1 Tax=Pyronema omphalodes (strain CBS 100304) TaxID=1076935 RepID=U4L3N7_PYROM|nr:ankyrin repeat-containing domain protein [Pyronema domesticum]CCX11360.1 Similar to Osteoclast-stimulating factor 1; acc. no. Q8MJ50 [Pyronema omphalodes CBS 100304]